MRPASDAIGLPVEVDERTPAQKVLDGLIQRGQRNGLTRSQREFIPTCMTMLREDDPRRPVLGRLLA